MSYSANWGLILSSLAFFTLLSTRMKSGLLFPSVTNLYLSSSLLLCVYYVAVSVANLHLTLYKKGNLRISICDKYFLNTSVSF